MSWAAVLGSSALEGGLAWLGAMAFIDPLAHRDRYPLRAALGLPVLMLAALLLYPLGQDEWALLHRALMGLVVALLAYSCARLPLMGAAYCAVLAQVGMQAVHELWMAVQGLALGGSTLPWRQFWWVEVAFSALLFALLRFTACRWMPWNGGYDVGIGQLASAALLALLFSILFELLSQGVGVVAWNEAIVLPAVLGQFYCLTVLYLQNELYKKGVLQRELNTLNLLYEQQKRQYANARRGVELINRRCHALKVELARLRAAGAPPDPQAEQAVQALDAMVRTGSDVLDTVLTEKAMQCEDAGITLNCVADGVCLEFLDPADLYGLFAAALDNALEAVSGFAAPDRRLVEVLVRRRQGFVVVNVANPVHGSVAIEDGLPRQKNHGYGLKNIRRIVRRYGGQLTSDVQDGVFTLRIVFPRPAP